MRKRRRGKYAHEKGLCVHIEQQWQFQRALNRFRRKIRNNKLLQQIKSRSYYQKPSVKKRRIRKEQQFKYMLQQRCKKQQFEKQF